MKARRVLASIAHVLVVASIFVTAAVGIPRASLWADRRYGTAVDTLPDWLAAVSTYAAFLAAGLAVYFAWRAFRIEATREARWEQDQRAAQASKVSAWFATETRETYFSGNAPSLRNVLSARTVRGVNIRNASDAPIYDVHVMVVDQDKLATRHSVLAADGVGTVPPTDEPMFVSLEGKLQAEGEDAARPGVVISFTDAAGVGWMRSADGRLVEQPELRA